MNAGHPVDKTEGIIRFIFGSGFGVLLCLGLGLSTGLFVLISLSFGYLAYKHGDRFWFKISDWWGMYR